MSENSTWCFATAVPNVLPIPNLLTVVFLARKGHLERKMKVLASKKTKEIPKASSRSAPFQELSFLKKFPPPRTIKLLCLLEETQLSWAGVWGGVWRGSPHRNKKDFP